MSAKNTRDQNNTQEVSSLSCSLKTGSNNTKILKRKIYIYEQKSSDRIIKDSLKRHRTVYKYIYIFIYIQCT